jgi:NAD-dependent deacetylase
MQHIVVLSGAGISAESGIKTFRDADGLWEGHDVMEVASPQGWNKNTFLVLDFYNQRRRQLHEVHPNEAHITLAKLEKNHKVSIITQNVDDLHERAGSTTILHLHGELLKARGVNSPNESLDWRGDIMIGDKNSKGEQIRPAIVWFGEDVPLIQNAAELVMDADIILIIGTSMQVYPAAGLVGYANRGTKIFYLDPAPQYNHELNIRQNLTVIKQKASIGIKEFERYLSEL